MQMTFIVGSNEQHQVMFSWDQVWGRLLITVDGQSVVDTVRMFSASRVKVYEFAVGYSERHGVRIEKRRALFFAGFRHQEVSAYVDGVLVARR